MLSSPVAFPESFLMTQWDVCVWGIPRLQHKMFLYCGSGCALLPSHDGRRTRGSSFHVTLNNASQRLDTTALAFTMNKPWTMIWLYPPKELPQTFILNTELFPNYCFLGKWDVNLIGCFWFIFIGNKITGCNLCTWMCEPSQESYV